MKSSSRTRRLGAPCRTGRATIKLGHTLTHLMGWGKCTSVVVIRENIINQARVRFNLHQNTRRRGSSASLSSSASRSSQRPS